ncbi:hypothetical protein G8A07_04225 [Roseateles sp. DAIF2]|uniref:hypothetical protein n=1 Tax=Roseateles sp. DAIF2 TaxID=2714952 RepID=UPI0018A32EA1|nr:hypothetical protein [Roseateles sp. DAIF2]QPF72213.1 hypothetical protein G8A07_04225 [Roseateles sp. DAIF2]
MSDRVPRARRADRLVAALVFGGLLAYCVHGALTGALFIPATRGGGAGVNLPAAAAWSLAGGFATLWLAVELRMGLLPALLRPRGRVCLEFLLLAAGLVLMWLAYRWPGPPA